MDDDALGGGGADDDLSLPKATIAKLIAEMLPEDITCAKETRDLMLECCVEFVHLLASEASDICDKTTKKTIGADQIAAALKNLGYGAYVDEVMAEQGLHKQEQKDRESKRSAASRFGDSGMSQDELARQQEELFKAAREKYQQRLVSESVPQTPVAETKSVTLPQPPSATTTEFKSEEEMADGDAVQAKLEPTGDQ